MIEPTNLFSNDIIQQKTQYMFLNANSTVNIYYFENANNREKKVSFMRFMHILTIYCGIMLVNFPKE